MKEKTLISCFFFLVFSAAVAVKRPRGVSLEKASFYQENQDFKCLRDGKVIPFAYVNDDYCDCDDGSDEPGTSACPNGLFFCNNKGYRGTYIRSSRVNDEICDCCDGSDEVGSHIDCPNTCIEFYKREIAQQEELRRNQIEGYRAKQEYMQQGKRAKDEKLSKLSDLEREKEVLNSEKDAADAAKTEAEEPETVAKEEHKKAWELVKEERQKAKDAKKANAVFNVLDANQDGILDYPEIMKHKEFDIDSDGTVSEEEAKEYLEENEQVDLATFTEKIMPNIKEIFKLSEDGHKEQAEGKDSAAATTDEQVTPDIPMEIPEGGAQEDSNHGEYEDNEEGEEEEEEEDDNEADSEYDIGEEKGDTASVEEQKEDDEEKEPEYSEETKRLIAIADEARQKFNEAERKLKDCEHEINDIKSYLEMDFGPNEEFAAMKGKCFEFTDREYTYRLCPFDKTSQKNKGGGMETSLGTWGKWHGPEGDKYDAMKYENGQGCWNGPSRSTHVNLHCGSTNEITSATEPSRCEYQFEFTTPAKCDEPKPVELNDIHDEL